MNTMLTHAPSPRALLAAPAASSARLRLRGLRLELILFSVILMALNAPLLAGQPWRSLVWAPSAVSAGEWWRLLAHPFVHVSAYHLVLDASAFLLAYAELRERGWCERLSLVAAAGAGSVLAAWSAAPLVETHGLCGLSGIAHGLTAVVGVDLLRSGRDRAMRVAGLLCFAGVVVKSLVEAGTGDVMLISWHVGSLGTPVAVSHAGGVLGALVVELLARRGREWRVSRNGDPGPSLPRT